MEEYINGECDIPVCSYSFGSSDEWGGGRVPSITTWNAVDEVGNDGSEDEDDKMEEQDIT